MRSRLSSRALTAFTLLVAALSACAAPDDDRRSRAAPAREPVAPDPGLRAAIAADTEAFAAHERPAVTVTITNAGARPERLLAWYFEPGELAPPIVSLWRDGAPVAYLGPLVKRPAPGIDDFITLAPGASVSRRVDLAGSYDLSQSGDYTIRVELPAGKLRGGPAAGGLYVRADDVMIWSEGRPGDSPPDDPPVIVGPLTFTGNCTATEQATLSEAVGVAAGMSDDARDYLAGVPSAASRYVTWFGGFSTSRWTIASAHFEGITEAFAEPLALDCKCGGNSSYAYVYSDEPYKIYLCGLFWDAPMAGSDSKGGTLVHEMSHFDVVAGTDDWVYGESAARDLAASSPDQALDNADNHEYFAENSPALP